MRGRGLSGRQRALQLVPLVLVFAVLRRGQDAPVEDLPSGTTRRRRVSRGGAAEAGAAVQPGAVPENLPVVAVGRLGQLQQELRGRGDEEEEGVSRGGLQGDRPAAEGVRGGRVSGGLCLGRVGKVELLLRQPGDQEQEEDGAAATTARRRALCGGQLSQERVPV